MGFLYPPLLGLGNEGGTPLHRRVRGGGLSGPYPVSRDPVTGNYADQRHRLSMCSPLAAQPSEIPTVILDSRARGHPKHAQEEMLV